MNTITQNDIISYPDMCQREGCNLQRGMNFRLGGTYSVILMSLRPNAPYADRIEDDGTTLIYEGHDEHRTTACPNPKAVDQPAATPKGTLTQNGKFFQAAQDSKAGKSPTEQVKVYEKLRDGIWAYNGVFQLVDAWQEKIDNRCVFKFKLIAVEGGVEATSVASDIQRRRIIPTKVKLEVWKRDGGQCVKCGSKDELHFDHVLPFARGGTSITAANVQLLCARHNLEKSDKIL